jgi:hypothetical protein
MDGMARRHVSSFCCGLVWSRSQFEENKKRFAVAVYDPARSPENGVYHSVHDVVALRYATTRHARVSPHPFGQLLAQCPT